MSYFITLEGGEGAGKSTALAAVREWLENRGIPLVCTREPGGTRIGEKIRDILLDPGNRELSRMTELLMMFAARAQHLDEIIRPALERGRWVLCDRFTDSSRAYQGYGREMGLEAIEKLVGVVHPDLQPDITFLLDVPVDAGLERVNGRGTPDRLELDGSTFLEKVRAGYLALARKEPGRFALIDASRPPEAVTEQIRQVLQERLGQKR